MLRRQLAASWSFHTALALALAGAATGCKTGPGGDDSSVHPAATTSAAQGAPSGVRLPAALPLPAEPDTLMHLESPAQTAAFAGQWAPPGQHLDPNAWLAMELGHFVAPEFAKPIAQACDPYAAWSGVQWAQAQVFHLPLTQGPEGLAALQARFAEQPAVGDFGAVSLGTTPDGRPILAWARDTNAGPRLTLADSEAALINGIELGPAYGKAPFVATLDVERMRLPIDTQIVPVTRVWIEGPLHELDIRVQLREGEDPLAEGKLGEGAMAALLLDPATLVGGSSRYLDHQAAVSRVISSIQGQLDDLPFLLKGYATDLAKRFNSILRTWNGRVLASVAQGHLRVAYGADDPKKSGVAILHFLRGALDGLSLVRNFSSDVPDIRLRKNAARSGQVEVHRLDIRGARGVPAPLRALLDKDKALHIAMAFDPKFGGGLLVVGPDAAAQAVSWIESTPKAVVPTQDGAPVAVRAALSGTQVQSLLRAAEGEQDMAKFLSWTADGPPVDIELRQEGPGQMRARIRSPKVAKQMRLVLPHQPDVQPAAEPDVQPGAQPLAPQPDAGQP